jgi:hypothetical protein
VALAVSGNGITVTADDVAINLMGFTITGPGVGFTGYGITGDFSAYKNLSVRGGTLVAWPDVAIYGAGFIPSSYEDLVIRKSGKGLAADSYATARNIQLDDTADIAIDMHISSRIDGCMVRTASVGVASRQVV